MSLFKGMRIIHKDTPVINLADHAGRLRLLPAASYDEFAPDSIRLWCNRHARYGLPTIELIDWLKTRIAGKKAIEVGAGAGDLSYHLGTLPTDNRMQEWPHIRQHYQLTGQPTIKYPPEVEEIDALDAVTKYRPDVVVASWITEWTSPDLHTYGILMSAYGGSAARALPPPPQGGNMYGVREDMILEMKVTYILIGNDSVHGKKKIMALPHKEFNLPFLRSRASQPELDRVYVWEP